jgi:hypothetical protein
MRKRDLLVDTWIERFCNWLGALSLLKPAHQFLVAGRIVVPSQEPSPHELVTELKRKINEAPNEGYV